MFAPAASGPEKSPRSAAQFLLRPSDAVQGVVKAFDPGTRTGIILTDSDLREVELHEDALVGSILRTLRPGQRVVFDVTSDGLATRLRLGSEVDMGTPGF
jgi:CspA family cold shock protein